MRFFISPFRFLNVDKKPNVQFWLTQAIILVSTVMGVYLASLAGFQIAVNFDRYQSLSDVRHIERSLYAEVSDNIATVENWADTYRAGPMVWHDPAFSPRDRHQLDTTIWMTMRYSPRTFELNADILTGVRRFYAAVESARNIVTAQNLPNVLANRAMQDMKAAAEQTRADILPLILAAIDDHESQLSSLLD
ncbi:MAG: hypothetical protein ABID63_08510 [Pseudomonadota bacterium]